MYEYAMKWENGLLVCMSARIREVSVLAWQDICLSKYLDILS